MNPKNPWKWAGKNYVDDLMQARTMLTNSHTQEPQGMSLHSLAPQRRPSGHESIKVLQYTSVWVHSCNSCKGAYPHVYLLTSTGALSMETKMHLSLAGTPRLAPDIPCPQTRHKHYCMSLFETIQHISEVPDQNPTSSPK